MVILFDLDGTLLDTSHDIHHAVNTLLEEEKKSPVKYEVVRPCISFGGHNILEHAFELDIHNPIDCKYLELLAPRLQVLAKKTNFAKTIAFPGIDKLLQDLDYKNIPWGIVTNRVQALTEPLLKNKGYFERSACIVSGDTTSYSKPHPEPLHHACRLLQVNPQDCLYVGDAITDVQAGKAAGMATIAVGFGFVPYNDSIHNWQADYTADHAEEILPRIEQWSKKV